MRPRHARKEVRQVADWLDDNGWKYDSDDNSGHTIWRWPATGQTIKLPETPRGHGWVSRTRASALAIMGAQVTGKRDPAAARQREADRRAAERANRQRLTYQAARQAEQRRTAEQRRRTLIAAEDNFRFYASLMQPGR